MKPQFQPRNENTDETAYYKWYVKIMSDFCACVMRFFRKFEKTIDISAEKW